MDDDDEEFARDGKNIRRLLNLNFFYNAATSTYKNKNSLRRAVRRRRALVSAKSQTAKSLLRWKDSQILRFVPVVSFFSPEKLTTGKARKCCQVTAGKE